MMFNIIDMETAFPETVYGVAFPVMFIGRFSQKTVCFPSQSWHLSKPHDAKLVDVIRCVALERLARVGSSQTLRTSCTSTHRPPSHASLLALKDGPQHAGRTHTDSSPQTCLQSTIRNQMVRKKFEIGSKTLQGIVFGTILESFWNHFGRPSCNRFEIGLKTVRNRFKNPSGNRFGTVLESFWKAPSAMRLHVDTLGKANFS